MEQLLFRNKENHLFYFNFYVKCSNFATSFKVMRIKSFIFIYINVLLLLSIPMYGFTANKDFVVVIDAGHGGKDPGAVGRKAREKDINLNVALEVGRLIENNCKNTRVLYTRKTDIFVSLDKRARIANDAKADLFISIHTNALPKGRIAKGTETYTLGMARADENLEVAKRENAVILVEDNYQEQYAGFNPNSAESYIMFEFMQDKHMEQSVSFAKQIQHQFKHHAHRVDKGVHQAGFLVLRATSMPSVLIELGYISTPDEERYLNSSSGIQALSRSIYNAFCDYKKSQVNETVRTDKEDEKMTQISKEPAIPSKKESQQTVSLNKPIFKLQILTSSSPLKEKSSQLKGLPAVYYKEAGLYKYTYGDTNDYNEILQLKNKINKKFKDAFVIAFKDGKKINLQQAIKDYQREQNE